LSVVLAAAAVAAAAAESALIKLASRVSLSWGWVGVSMGVWEACCQCAHSSRV
jgi:hypothetical protein